MIFDTKIQNIWKIFWAIKFALIRHVRAIRNFFTLLIDNMINLTITIQKYCQWIVKFDILIIGSQNSAVHRYWIVSEIRVDTSTPGFMILNIFIDFVWSISIFSIRVIYIIWKLWLVKVSFAIFTIPFK